MKILDNAPYIRGEKVNISIEHNYNSVQVAGTNGKGSTCAFLCSILQEHGLKVGLYTSPHIIDFTERISVNGENISQADFERLVKQVDSEQANLCRSDLLFICAVRYFNEQNIDFAVFETGLGGTRDSATLIDHKYGILTHIDLDHVDLLGDTIETITKEKCGIIKDDMTLVSYPNECMELIEQSCIDKNAKFIDTTNVEISKQGFSFEYNGYDFSNIQLQMKGEHQKQNAVCSVACAIEVLKDKFDVDKCVKALNNTCVLGRMTVLNEKPLVICDVSHNKDGVNVMCNYIDSLEGKKCAVVSVVTTKDYKAIVERLKDSFDTIIATKAEDNCFEPELFDVDIKESDLSKAIATAKQGEHDIIVFCGSFSIVRQVIKKDVIPF